MSSSHLLVGNPTAQSGRNAARIDRALGILQRRGMPCELFATLPAGRTIDALRQRLDARPYQTVISMGGDGTFREVASALLQSTRREEAALGMLPTGTANDQGRSFSMHARDEALEANVEVLLERCETRLDAGHLRSRSGDGTAAATAHFFDSASWGLSARVLATRNRDRRLVEGLGPLRHLYRDKLVYAGALLKRFAESYVVPDKFRAFGRADGRAFELDGLTDLVVKGTRVWAGSWVFDRQARHNDGYFEVIPFRGKRDWTSKALVDHELNPVTEEMLNQLGIEHSHPFRAHHLELTLLPPPGGAPLATQLDGDEFPAHEHLEITVLPRALRLLVPRAHADHP